MLMYHLPHVLLIDDDEDDREMFSNALHAVSPLSTLHTFGTCNTAIEMVEKNKIPVPNVIFLDLMLPEVNGTECALIIRNHSLLKEVNVIIMSTLKDQSQLDELYEAGITYFISKPPTFSKLKAIIDRMVNTPAIFDQRTRENFHSNSADN